jgi:hypothetical protein
VLAAAEVSKAPSASELQEFLAPLLAAYKAGTNPDNRSATYNQLKTFEEGQNGAFLWVQVNPTTAGTTPKAHVQDTLEAAAFYNDKVFADAKKTGNEAVGKFAATFKAMMQALVKFTAAHYPTGIEYNHQVRAQRRSSLCRIAASSAACECM